MIGTNDRRQLKGPDLLRENLLYILQMFEESGKKVVLMSANPVVLADDQKENRYHRQCDMNAVITEVANETKVSFINHYVMIEEYLNVTNQTIDELMLGPDKKGDGLHPNDEVYQLMFKHMINSLEI